MANLTRSAGRTESAHRKRRGSTPRQFIPQTLRVTVVGVDGKCERWLLTPLLAHQTGSGANQLVATNRRTRCSLHV